MSRCSQCQVMMIQGVRCHETGCPLAHRDESRECDWCGSKFTPENKNQQCCDDDCYRYWCGFGGDQPLEPGEDFEDEGDDEGNVLDTAIISRAEIEAALSVCMKAGA